MARMSSILQSHGTMDPNLNLHLSFQDTPFCLITCFVCPCSTLFDCSFLCMLSSQLFLCLYTSLFPLSLHVHAWSMDTWSKGVTSYVQAKKCKNASKNMQAHKGQCSVDQEVQPPRVVISLSLLAFPQSLVLGFSSLYPALGRFPRVWHMSVLYFQYLVGPYPFDVGMYHLSFLHFALATFLGYGNV